MRSLLTALWALVAGLVKSIGEVIYLQLTGLLTRTGALQHFNLPNGATIDFGSTVGTAKVMSTISNAAEAIAALAVGHSIIEDDIFFVKTTGWAKLKNRVARAKDVDTDNNVTLEGIDTSDTTKFPVGTGAGTIQEVTAWTNIPYIQDAAAQGGEQQYVTLQFLDFDEEFEEPTRKTARRFTFMVADDQAAPHFDLLVAINDSRAPTVVRITLPTDDVIYFVAIISFDKFPKLTNDQLMANATSMAIRAEPTRYAAA